MPNCSQRQVTREGHEEGQLSTLRKYPGMEGFLYGLSGVLQSQCLSVMKNFC